MSLTTVHTFDPITNRLKGITGPAGYNFAYDYDDQGNVKQRGAQKYMFDQGNRMKEATGKATYVYDGWGRRSSVVGTDGLNRMYVYNQSGKLMYSGPTSASKRKYIYLGNHMIAEDGDAGLEYVHTDALGSPVARTSRNAALISRTRYEPYGLTAIGAEPTIGFTGHVNDFATGLVYMQQRYYDPIAGRMLSIDPVTTDANTGSSFNRYAYATNSPYKYIDPDGCEVQIVGATKFRNEAEAAINKIKEGIRGAALMRKAEGSSKIIKIVESPDSANRTKITDSKNASNGVGAGSTVEFGPTNDQGGKDATGSTTRPSFVGLAHKNRARSNRHRRQTEL